MDPAEKAILAQILNENEPVVSDLLNQLRGVQGVVPFVGAGLSKPFGLPLWKEFLQDLIDLVASDVARNRLTDLVDQWKYEETAEELEAELKPFFMFDKSRSIYRTPPDFDPTDKAIASIPAITKDLVVTTNYDRLLEATFERAGRPLSVVRGQDSAQLERLINQGSVCLWKMHGDLDDTDKRTLTFGEYERNYEHVGGQHLRSIRSIGGVLMELSARCSFVFVGCSLSEDRTTQILRKVAELLPAPRHFAILQDPGKYGKSRRAAELEAMRIRPIWYPSDPPDAREKHRGARIFLAYLAGQAHVWPRRSVWMHSACAKVALTLAVVAIFVERLFPGVGPGKFHSGAKAIVLTLLLVLGIVFVVSGWHILRRAGRLPTWWNSRPITRPGLHAFPDMQREARLAILAFSFPFLWTYGHFLRLIFAEGSIYHYGGDSGLPPLRQWALFSFPPRWWDPAAWRWDHPIVGFSAYPGIQMWVYTIGFFLLLSVVLLAIGLIPRAASRSEAQFAPAGSNGTE